MAENAVYRQARRDAISVNQVEVIEGELLGDGSLSSRSDLTARYQHQGKYIEYLAWLAGRIDLRYSGPTACGRGYHFSTQSYFDLKPIYDRWYMATGKVIPADLILSSNMCLHWYLGDGGLSSYRGGYKPLVSIATYCFHRDSIAHLVDQLSEFRPRFIHQQKGMLDGFGYRLILELDFLDYIGPCPSEIEPIYGYKWRWLPARRPRTRSGKTA